MRIPPHGYATTLDWPLKMKFTTIDRDVVEASFGGLLTETAWFLDPTEDLAPNIQHLQMT